MTPHDPYDHGPGSGGHSLPLTEPLPGPKVPGTVNVIFRGMFLFYQRKHMIDVLIPNIGSEHVYRAGLFLGETSLQPRPISEPYVLRGVELGEEGFESLSFGGYPLSVNITQQDVWARVVVPRPSRKILSLRPTAFGVSAEDPWNLVNTKNFDIMHVLRYKAADLRAVHLARHSTPNIDDPGIHSVDGQSFLNIHVVSEPEVQGGGMMHPIHGFQKMMNLFEGLQGTISLTDNQPTTIKDLETVAEDLSLGFSRLELITYSEQRNLMIRAGRHWRLDNSAGPSANALLVDSPPNQCLPGTGGD